MNVPATIRRFAYPLVAGGLILMGGLIPHQATRDLIGLIFIFILLPIGMLLLHDQYQASKGGTLFALVFHPLFRVVLALFGLVVLFSGMAFIAWVVMNLFIEAQPEYLQGVVAGPWSFGLGSVQVIAGGMLLRKVFQRKE